MSPAASVTVISSSMYSPSDLFDRAADDDVGEGLSRWNHSNSTPMTGTLQCRFQVVGMYFASARRISS